MLALPIVVGIDGGPASIAALRAALREVELRQTEVRSIICWPADGARADSEPVPCDSHDRASEILEHVIAEATLPDQIHVPIVREVSQSYAGPTLVAAARNADILVVGTTDRGPGTRHSTHHTVEHCLRYSVSPVLVVPQTVGVTDERNVGSDIRQASLTR